jgi:hypothetical protein
MLNARASLSRNTSIGAILLALIISAGCPLDNTIALVASLTSNRNTVESYVRQVKLRYQTGEPIYSEAQTRYAAAYAAYTTYVAAVRLNLLTGGKQDVTTLASQSQSATNAFIAYVTGNLSATTRSLLAQPITLTTIGTFLIGKAKQEVRNQEASLFASAVQWKAWNDIN